MDVNRFEKLPLLGIVRGVEKSDIGPLIRSVIDAGLETLEITMNTKGAPQLIADAVKEAGGRLVIGAGTVLSKKDLDSALGAGATFIVMPACISDVVKICVKRKVPVFPGALTPQEVFNAWEMGATMVKVFPAGVFGPKYMKELKGPFKDVKLMAVGGVSPDNVPEFFSHGADAVAFGASVFTRDRLEKKDFAAIEKHVREFVEKVKAVRKA
jgi:2-dehydro-3-deoxyphosphogluconate aldolase/(4S)-4-hydroxy-2-oxoglutarate aldolase